MIHLDTNLLIALPLLQRERHPLLQKMLADVELATSAEAWFEFACGPLSQAEQTAVEALIDGKITPTTRAIAERAAALFNAEGRIRRMRTDCLIAACAMEAKAELWTYNGQDFECFAKHGLKLQTLP